MRGFIRLCSSVFVLLGMATMVVTVLVAIKALSLGAASADGLGGAAALAVGILVLVIGFLGGASLTLIGGAAYLLASIDYRLELAGKRTPEVTPMAETFGVTESGVPSIV